MYMANTVKTSYLWHLLKYRHSRTSIDKWEETEKWADRIKLFKERGMNSIRATGTGAMHDWGTPLDLCCTFFCSQFEHKLRQFPETESWPGHHHHRSTTSSDVCNIFRHFSPTSMKTELDFKVNNLVINWISSFIYLIPPNIPKWVNVDSWMNQSNQWLYHSSLALSCCVGGH